MKRKFLIILSLFNTVFCCGFFQSNPDFQNGQNASLSFFNTPSFSTDLNIAISSPEIDLENYQTLFQRIEEIRQICASDPVVNAGYACCFLDFKCYKRSLKHFSLAYQLSSKVEDQTRIKNMDISIEGNDYRFRIGKLLCFFTEQNDKDEFLYQTLDLTVTKRLDLLNEIVNLYDSNPPSNVNNYRN
jgi:hypothetical protein